MKSWCWIGCSSFESDVNEYASKTCWWHQCCWCFSNVHTPVPCAHRNTWRCVVTRPRRFGNGLVVGVTMPISFYWIVCSYLTGGDAAWFQWHLFDMNEIRRSNRYFHTIRIVPKWTDILMNEILVPPPPPPHNLHLKISLQSQKARRLLLEVGWSTNTSWGCKLKDSVFYTMKCYDLFIIKLGDSLILSAKLGYHIYILFLNKWKYFYINVGWGWLWT